MPIIYKPFGAASEFQDYSYNFNLPSAGAGSGWAVFRIRREGTEYMNSKALLKPDNKEIYDPIAEDNNCMNCRYEPVWGKWVGSGEATRCSGKCRYNVPDIVLPKSCKLVSDFILRYKFSGDCGFQDCPAWKPCTG